MDRRQFLSTSLMTVAAFKGTVADGASLSTPAAPGARSTTELLFSEARFRALLGSRFQFTGDEWRGPLQLTDVVSRTSTGHLEQFTTVFSANTPTRPAPGIYSVVHPEGRFMLRIDEQDSSDRLQATFAILRG